MYENLVRVLSEEKIKRKKKRMKSLTNKAILALCVHHTHRILISVHHTLRHRHTHYHLSGISLSLSFFLFFWLGPRQWERRVLTIGLPGNSLLCLLKLLIYQYLLKKLCARFHHRPQKNPFNFQTTTAPSSAVVIGSTLRIRTGHGNIRIRWSTQPGNHGYSAHQTLQQGDTGRNLVTNDKEHPHVPIVIRQQKAGTQSPKVYPEYVENEITSGKLSGRNRQFYAYLITYRVQSSHGLY